MAIFYMITFVVIKWTIDDAGKEGSRITDGLQSKYTSDPLQRTGTSASLR
jgi:hypothetical protein